MSKARPIGVLRIIAGLMVLSSVLRVGIGAQEAFANPDTTIVPPEDTELQETGDPSEDILSAIQAREARLAEREGQFADRMQALNVAEREVARQIAVLQEAEQALSSTMALADTASESDLAKLTTVYENMAPKDAAALFEQMPPEFAAGFLGMMDPNAAAKIMTGLTPETAYSFSVVLAGRNALVPKQ